MVTYNEIYEAAKKNPLVLFESPQNTERKHLSIASYKCCVVALRGI